MKTYLIAAAAALSLASAAEAGNTANSRHREVREQWAEARAGHPDYTLPQVVQAIFGLDGPDGTAIAKARSRSGEVGSDGGSAKGIESN